jgi:hypothetical protein
VAGVVVRKTERVVRTALLVSDYNSYFLSFLGFTSWMLEQSDELYGSMPTTLIERGSILHADAHEIAFEPYMTQ